jgi:hypothetical protein
VKLPDACRQIAAELQNLGRPIKARRDDARSLPATKSEDQEQSPRTTKTPDRQGSVRLPDRPPRLAFLARAPPHKRSPVKSRRCSILLLTEQLGSELVDPFAFANAILIAFGNGIGIVRKKLKQHRTIHMENPPAGHCRRVWAFNTLGDLAHLVEVPPWVV